MGACLRQHWGINPPPCRKQKENPHRFSYPFPPVFASCLEVLYIKIVERDYKIFEQITKWRFLLSRQIRVLCNFPSVRTVDRRLAILIEAGYLKREYVLFGLPPLYFVTPKAKEIFNLDYITSNARVGLINHQINVVDTAIYFLNKLKVENLHTERELKYLKGFSIREHCPDFVLSLDNKKIAVEIELTLKNKSTLKKNIESNYNNYNRQIWVIPKNQVRIIQVVEEAQDFYSGIEVIELEEVQAYIKKL